MKTKELYVIVSNGGDGSYYPQFTFNKEYLDKLQQQCDNDDPDFDYETYSDGDGFHYTTLIVPARCTLESLGISYDFAQDD